jgi:membrane protein YdbS with pleckstrin-like domain
MNRLSPKAIWLFFISYLIRLGIIPVGFGLYLVSLLPSESATLSGAFYSSILVSIIANIVLWILLSLLWAWLTQHHFRYSLQENYFQKEVGVLYKKYITIPYENIQNIEIDRRVLSRLLGLSEIMIETASSHTRSEGRVPGLKHEEAEQLKDELIRRAHQKKTSK